MRRYRIDVWPAQKGPRWECGAVDRLSSMETAAPDFERANNPDDMGREDWEAVRRLTFGQSVTLGGGAAPVAIITCIEE